MKYLKSFDNYMDPMGKWYDRTVHSDRKNRPKKSEIYIETDEPIEITKPMEIETEIVSNWSKFEGRHVLGAIDYDYSDSSDIGNTILITLDNITYEVTEDPSDGYRSYLGDIKITDKKVSNRLYGVEVDVKFEYDESGFQGLVFTDIENGLEILRLGTDYSDDYYPFCIMWWEPRNIHYNAEAEKFNM